MISEVTQIDPINLWRSVKSTRTFLGYDGAPGDQSMGPECSHGYCTNWFTTVSDWKSFAQLRALLWVQFVCTAGSFVDTMSHYNLFGTGGTAQWVQTLQDNGHGTMGRTLDAFGTDLEGMEQFGSAQPLTFSKVECSLDWL